MHARHILVATEEDAKAIKAELATGKPFEVLAMEKSLDPGGAQNGGDLGFFRKGMMVKPFEDAAFALTEPGQLSEPIQTQFGWHIIKLEEKPRRRAADLRGDGPAAPAAGAVRDLRRHGRRPQGQRHDRHSRSGARRGRRGAEPARGRSSRLRQ